MSSKKTIIHEFDPCVYPRLLWVVKGGTREAIKETLEFLDIDEEAGAVTFPARRKKDGHLGYCVYFPLAGDIRRGDYIAHEATHVALCIFNDVGAVVDYDNQEPLAYLIGWVFECVDKVRRMKNDNGKERKHLGEAKEGAS